MTGRSVQHRLSWTPRATAVDVLARLQRRLPDARDLAAAPYHHPFAGFIFGSPGGPGSLHVIVDQVGGRAFLTDPWESEVGLSEHSATAHSTIRDPRPRITDEAAAEAARQLVGAVLQRRHRLGLPGPIELRDGPVLLAKPNWWVTGSRRARRVEIIVDAMTGRHYTVTA